MRIFGKLRWSACIERCLQCLLTENEALYPETRFVYYIILKCKHENNNNSFKVFYLHTGKWKKRRNLREAGISTQYENSVGGVPGFLHLRFWQKMKIVHNLIVVSLLKSFYIFSINIQTNIHCVHILKNIWEAYRDGRVANKAWVYYFRK